MMLLTGKKKNKGFLLLEVMVSATILSVGLVLILNSFMSSLRAIEYSEDYFKAGLLLEAKLYEASNSDMEEGYTNGVFTDFGDKFSWSIDVARLVEDDSLKEANIKVSWNQGTKEQVFSATAYLP